jgi:hypothetical protein
MKPTRNRFFRDFAICLLTTKQNRTTQAEQPWGMQGEGETTRPFLPTEGNPHGSTEQRPRRTTRISTTTKPHAPIKADPNTVHLGNSRGLGSSQELTAISFRCKRRVLYAASRLPAWIQSKELLRSTTGERERERQMRAGSKRAGGRRDATAAESGAGRRTEGEEGGREGSCL